MAHDGFAPLTRGEKLFVQRRRDGINQRAAAKRLKVPLGVYGRLELDDAPDIRTLAVKIGKLEAHERCVIMRRRVGYTQAKVAKALKCCRWWLNQMETGRQDCTPLTDYWNS